MGISYQLTMRQGPFPNNHYPLINDHTIIGRATSCDIHIPDPEISRQHARVTAQGAGMYAIEDLGSTNGTFVNGRRATSLTPINHNDIIGLGEALQFIFEASSDKIDTTPDFIIPGTGGSYITNSAQSGEPELPPPFNEPKHIPPIQENVIIHQIEQPKSSKRELLIGCGGVLLLTACCIGGLFALDAYHGGELLYCGPLRPFWDVILLPFGSPPCG